MILKNCQITKGQGVAITSGIPTPEQLAEYWAVAKMGRHPTVSEMEKAKQRRDRRGVGYMQQTQLELDLLDVMRENDGGDLSFEFEFDLFDWNVDWGDIERALDEWDVDWDAMEIYNSN